VTVEAGGGAEDAAGAAAGAGWEDVGRAVFMPPLEVAAGAGAEVVEAAGKVAGMNRETMYASRCRSVSPAGASGRAGGIG